MTRVLLADDQTLVRSGFRLVLEHNGLEVCAEAADGREAVRLTRRHSPDVVLMDIRMPALDGIRATQQIVAADLGARVLVLTTFDIDDYVIEALQVGASGYLLKDVEPADLVAAVRAVAAGDMPLAPSVLRRVVAAYAAQRKPPPGLHVERLSERERQVLDLLGRGLTNAEICDNLVVSMATTKTHVAAVLAKLGLRDRVQAAIYAHENGLIPRTTTSIPADDLNR